jgi:hypothetical protein
VEYAGDAEEYAQHYTTLSHWTLNEGAAESRIQVQLIG